MASFTFDDYLREMYLTVEDIKAMKPETQEVERGRFIEWLKLKNQTQTEEQFDRYQSQTEVQFDRFRREIQELNQTQTEMQFGRFHREIQEIKDLMMTQKSAPGNIHLRWHSIIP